MKITLLISVFMLSLFALNAQEAAKKSKKELKAEKKAQQIADTQALVDGKVFVFKATNANPMRGRTVNLTTSYDVKITADSIYSYLPYYGVAYSANYGGTDSPMIFDKPFESYDMEKTKNGYRVKVAVKNGNDRLEFNFNISETGFTSLQVSSLNRQSISYNGNLEKIEKKEKK